MDAFVMVVAGGLTIGIGSEKVSWEMEHGLDLRGEWGGTYRVDEMPPFNAHPVGPVLTVFSNARDERLSPIVDDGGGKFHVGRRLGIYKWEGDHVVLTFWQGSNRNWRVLTLHRVPPRK